MKQEESLESLVEEPIRDIQELDLEAEALHSK